MNKFRSPVFSAILIALSITACRQDPTSGTDKTGMLPVPFEQVQITKSNYEINTDQDTILYYSTGSKLVIPKDAFLDKDGKPVTGSVQLKYREFTNPFEIYLGGIPMVYDSAGEEMVFETAGMLEINAFSNNQPVFPNPDKPITIKMTSFNGDAGFNEYALDTNTGKWALLGKNKVEIKNYQDALDSLPEVPPHPIKAGPFAFTIGDATGNYPELSMYKNVMFEPVDFKKAGYDCTRIKVRNIGGGIYEVTFVVDAFGIYDEKKVNCYLAFKEGADYTDAMKVYQQKYKHLIAKRDKLYHELNKEWDAYFSVKKKYEDLGLMDLFNKRNVKNLTSEDKIERTLELSGFGFVNCDYPRSYPSGANLIAQFTDKQNNPLNLQYLTLIEFGSSTLYRYTKSIKFNPGQKNVLWGLTPDGKLAYFGPNDFSKVDKTKGEYTFAMTVHPEKLETYEDICKVLFK